MFADIGTVAEYFKMGGPVMGPLVFVAVLMWYGLIYRLSHIKKTRKGPRRLIKKARKGKLNSKAITAQGARIAIQLSQEPISSGSLKQKINEHFNQLRIDMDKHRAQVRSLVLVAPLLGLLGTVDGMIETFSALGDMALFTQTGGIAGGISRALFTTQMGLAISIPGLLLGRMIERRQINIQRDLDQIRDLVCARKR